ncbi:MAG: methanogenesis marker 14 protein [Candidatus Thorarchaeota archaeon]
MSRVVKPKRIGTSSLRQGPFYTVASVELGNTTSKCIIMSTNLETAEVYEIDKEVRMTRDVREPKDGESVFGTTLVGVELTQESVAELVRDVLLTVLNRTRLKIESDLHFVVRSTGVNAGFAEPAEVGAIVKALAQGCLDAGIPPRLMTSSMSPDNLPPGLQSYTWLKKVYFDGAVASSLPPANTEIVANEMEGELVTAGLKGAAKSTTIDFRNPVMTLDFGTTLAGRVTDNSYPYAETIGSFVGLAGAIPDAIARGTELVTSSSGCILDIENSDRIRQNTIDAEAVQKAHALIVVKKVSRGTDRFGTVPVNVEAAMESGVSLIGVDVGVNGSDLDKLSSIGAHLHEKGEIDLLLATIDGIQSVLVQRILTIAESEELISEDTSLGLTGRAITTGKKPKLIHDQLKLSDGTHWIDSHQLMFVEDGLAIGAAVAARCMNSLGTRHNPMGGRKGDGCVMGARIKLQREKQ